MDAEAILQKLKEQGRITEEDIQGANLCYMNTDRQHFVDVFHAMFCTRDHDTEKCWWYTEEQMDNTWQRDSHAKWVSAAIGVIIDLNITWEGFRAILVAIESVTASTNWTGDNLVSFLRLIADSFSEHVLNAISSTLPNPEP